MVFREITRREAKVLAAEEFDRFAEVVGKLSDDDWSTDTDCTGWDVRAMALHVLGAAEGQASVPELVHQFRRGLPLNKEIESHHFVDGINELQIRERNHLANADIAEQLAAIGSRAVRGRWRTPPPLRYVPINFGAPVGWKPMKYLLDVGFTRDVWAHRIDIHAVVDQPIHLTPEHDGLLVADIVGEWASTHREPFELTLLGPAGGTFSQGTGGEAVEIDAVEFIRVLSGRVEGQGVLRHPLPL